MAGVDISVDTRAVEAMLERIGSPRDLSGAVERAAEIGAGMITGIPVGETGDLANSMHGTPGRSPSRNSALIVSDVPYAPFVFGGTRYMDAQPPTVPADAIASVLADEIHRELFGR
jgi:hypothetical protein